ncbi:MAG: molybdate ABC transporter substrate-binding protein [Lysobacteraceae bacterium]|nr:MAG: molybdate ABC transporter substrate-binding protein [Xanthomonadaceae bacterium]
MRIVALGAWLLVLSAVARAQAPVVAAASDLKFALEEIAAAWEAGGGSPLRLSFGSSGLLASQIRQGAPYALFLSADEAYVLALHREGRVPDAGVLYARGRIALVVPRGGAVSADPDLRGLAGALAAGRVRRFAIAHPGHAPYGQRAAEVLRHAGLWAVLEPHLVLGENVSQAAQFVASGAAEGGLVALSLLAAPGLRDRFDHAVVPEDWHRPLLQRMVLLRPEDPVAAGFFRFLQQPAARRLLRRWGFQTPPQALP